MKRLIFFLPVLLLLLPGAGCKLPSWEDEGAATDPPGTETYSEPEKYWVATTEITLAWDPSPSEVAFYRLYCRSHGTVEWTLIAEVSSAGALEYTVDQGSFGNGDFNFGVVAVTVDAVESAMHTSLDATAYPTKGWYLHWVSSDIQIDPPPD